MIAILIACIVITEQKNVEITQEELTTYKSLPVNFFLDQSDARPELILLGKKLFNEKLLSASNQISCSSCHDLAKAGTDLQQFSISDNGIFTNRNSPTILNAAGHTSQFWDGRVLTVEEQALDSILSPKKMSMLNAESALTALKSRVDYIEDFKIAFPDEKNSLTFQNIGIAIGTYERTLTTPSRWDLFLNEDKDALSEEEKIGFIKFNELGCYICHGGQLLGGQMLMKVGLVNSWPNQKDLGRFEVTKNESDKMIFKVPSLRNVTVTGPYFHDGSVKSLHTAIKMMAYHQLGKEITDKEAASIELWLNSTAGILATED